MAHIHEKIDFTVAIFVVHEGKVLLIRWCSAADLDHLQPPMSSAVKWYCRAALREVEG